MKCSLVILTVLALTGCRPGQNTSDQQHEAGNSKSGLHASQVAVSNSYMAAAFHDLMGQDQPVIELVEPGMCPGHFDLRPSQVRKLHDCRLLLRFDFQDSLDSYLRNDRAKHLHIVPLTVTGGLCEPASYMAVCRQIAQALVEEKWLSPEDAEKRLAPISKRMDALNHWAKDQIEMASLRDKPVLSSGHQAAFCRSLGLNVAAPFSASDTASLSQVNQAIEAGEKAGIKLVIANLPEGRQLADALAERLDATVVIFGNFPTEKAPQAFDDLVRQNVAALIEASRS